MPLGLGAGAVDAGLNHFVARHYSARHMNWLHGCWGIGATIGPMVMGAALAGGAGWQGGYRIIALVQLVLAVLLLASLPIWRRGPGQHRASQRTAGRLAACRNIRLPGDAACGDAI